VLRRRPKGTGGCILDGTVCLRPIVFGMRIVSADPWGVGNAIRDTAGRQVTGNIGRSRHTASRRGGSAARRIEGDVSRTSNGAARARHRPVRGRTKRVEDRSALGSRTGQPGGVRAQARAAELAARRGMRVDVRKRRDNTHLCHDGYGHRIGARTGRLQAGCC